MPDVKSFNDSSAISVAYAIGSGSTPADFTGKPFSYIPYTSEGFQMSKEAKTSTAITNDRRPSNSKNTKGSASGAVTVEFGAPQFVRDLLALTLMSDWADADSAEASKGKVITDSDLKKFMCVEKTVKSGPDATDMLFHERYYGTAVNDATLAFSDGEFITLASNTMSVMADYAEAAAGVNGLGGSIASTKTLPEDYEIADSSNNLKSVVLKDDQGQALEVIFSDLSLQIQNNLREQSALGHEFAAGVGMGKVAATLSGEIYFYDHTILKAHMDNKRLSSSFDVTTTEGTYKFHFPSLVAQTPTNNSEGEDQDYTTSLTLAAERGTVTIEGTEHTCVIAIQFIPTP